MYRIMGLKSECLGLRVGDGVMVWGLLGLRKRKASDLRGHEARLWLRPQGWTCGQPSRRVRAENGDVRAPDSLCEHPSRFCYIGSVQTCIPGRNKVRLPVVLAYLSVAAAATVEDVEVLRYRKYNAITPRTP